ncbi:MAG: MotA/TolQ/ExbB proton channel family protein [Planctomycetota bacterium]|nr:MotA/TolQ/ExbB proton channel family protein [Planctomycetota bacterium]
MFERGALFDAFGTLIYVCQAIVALWGIYCVIMVWRRIAEKRFRSEESQAEFLDEIDQHLAQGEIDEAGKVCDDDPRALAQLVQLALQNRQAGYEPVRRLVTIRLQRDVLGDLNQRLQWVNHCIKVAPMLGLFGTVIGMMGAFGKLASLEQVSPDRLAADISLALVTTAIGLATAMPLMVALTSVNLRIADFQELGELGLTRFLQTFKATFAQAEPEASEAARPRKAAAGDTASAQAAAR